MTNSHLIGFITFIAFAFFALLAWYVSNTHPDVAPKPAERRRVRRTAVVFLVMGVLGGYGAFRIDNQMRATTLYEAMVEGSAHATPGSPAPVRTISFTVEHPGVAHELFLSPNSEKFGQANSAAEVAFSLQGPAGEVVLPETTEQFAPRTDDRSVRVDWEGRAFPFTPTVAGKHTLRVTPVTVGIPRIQVRIEDPKKQDGKRMSGY